MIISISGMENAGKTTQCNILRSEYPDVFLQTIHINNTCFFDHQRFDEAWWFNPGNEEFFVKSLYLCLLERIRMARKLGGVTLFDKGMDFYDTKVIAVLMIKGLSFDEAVMMQKDIKSRYIHHDSENIKFFLESNNCKRKQLDLSNPNDVRYNKYLVLNKELLDQNMKCFNVIPANDKEIVTQTIIDKITGLLGENSCVTKQLKRK